MKNSYHRFNFCLIVICLLVAWACDSAFSQGSSDAKHETMRIKNRDYSVTIDPVSGSFSVVNVRSGGEKLSAGRLSGQGGSGKEVELMDSVFGKGIGVEIRYPEGNREVVGLYDKLPFVTFRSILHNGGTVPRVLNHVPTISAAANLGKPLSEIRTLGSYAFLAIADPASRSGVVGGWITVDRGSGVVFSPVTNNGTRIQAQIDYGRLRINPGQDVSAEMFVLGYFEDARQGLESYADAIAQVYHVKLPPQPAGYCTWYMEKNAGASDEKHLAELTAYAAKNLKPYGFDFIQIDDGWQEGLRMANHNGPYKNFTAHYPSGPYPSGMKAAADNITSSGLTPGIWFMPFAGDYKDPFFKDHQDWFVKDKDGKPYDTAWGGTSLDMTHPEVLKYLGEEVRRISAEWGYKLFKMDGFYTGSATRQIYVNNGWKEDGIGDAEFFNPDKSNIEALRDGTRLVRKEAGSNVFLLGCCVSQNMRSFSGSFGLLDAMRVGPDTGEGGIGAPHASRLWFLNGRVWWNDPDCVSVRASASLDQARLNASFTAIAGDLFYNSDWMPDFPAERVDILRRCIPAHGLQSRPVDVFESPVARIWHLADTRQAKRRDVVAFYNWDKNPVSISCSTDRAGLPPAKEYVAFDFWANRFIPAFGKDLHVDLPPGGSCSVLAVQPVRAYPQLLSTSRHVTQGMVDVTEEHWDARTGVLSGCSKLVENDPYELRIAVPGMGTSWRAEKVLVSSEDQASGVTATVHQEEWQIRALLNSTSSRTVKWRVEFKRVRARLVEKETH